MIKYIKNIDTVTHTYSGQQIAAGAYYEIQPADEMNLANDSSLLADIGSGKALMAKDDSGNNDLTDINESINFLKNNIPAEVLTQKEKTDITLKMACAKSATDVNGFVQLDIKVPGTVGSGDGRYVEGGSAWFLNYHADDHFKVHIIDVDNILGYGAGAQVGSYTEDGTNAGFYAEPDGKVHVSSMGFFGFIQSGLYLRMEGQCGDGTTDTIYMNIIWGKKG
jgi:hypothetical protein